MQPKDSIAAAAADGSVGAVEGGAVREQTLWIAWRDSRDESARQTLLAMHLPYARVIAAMTYAQRTSDEIEFDDYLQLARMGMLESFDRYDPQRGAQFRTFAAWRMRGAVLDGLTRLTERQQQLTLRRQLLADRSASLVQQHRAEAGDPTAATGSAEDDLFHNLAEIGLGLAIGFMLEDTGMFSAGDEGSHVDPAYRSVELRHTRRELGGLVRQLPPAERRVIQLHYEQGHAFENIAQQLELTKGRISQIHKKALASLRTMLSGRGECDTSF